MYQLVLHKAAAPQALAIRYQQLHDWISYCRLRRPLAGLERTAYKPFMGGAVRIFYGVLAFFFTTAVCIIAYYAVFSLLKDAPSKSAVTVDYNGILTVLLTTVTVIFTVCAILLAILGIFGFRNLKRDAGRYAESQALAEIAQAFGPTGSGTMGIEREMRREDGHHRKFVEQRIRVEVISLLPLIANRINADALNMAIGEPTDEGDVD